MNRRARFPLLTLCLLAAAAAQGQSSRPAAKPVALTIPNIMRGEELIGTPPSGVRWSLDSQHVFFRWKQPGEPRGKTLDWYVVSRTGGPRRKLSDDEARSVVPQSGDATRDRRRLVFEDEGDLWRMTEGAPTRRRLTDTTEPETDPHWTRDETRLVFRRGDNLFVMPALPFPRDVSLTQLTDIRTGEPPAERSGGEIQRRARDIEKELFGAIRDKQTQRDEDESRRKAREAERRKPWRPGPRQSVADLRLSPDERDVLVFVRERLERAPQASVVPRYVTESGYVEAPSGRPLVGETLGQTRLVLLDVRTGAARTIEPPENLKNRVLSFLDARWSDQSEVQLAVMARALDNKDRWIFLVDRATGKSTLVHDTHDDAWVGGPGWADWGWMPGGARLWFCAEQTGWAHLYTIGADGKNVQPLTSGAWELFDPQLARDKTIWYFTSSEVDRGERHFYRMPVGGGPRTRLTTLPGRNDVTLSPDETTLAVVRSYTNQPPELYLQARVPGARPQRVTVSSAPEFRALALRDVPLVTFAARDGATVTARLFTPAAPRRNGPAVIFAHGAGYLQNAHRWWSQYEREFLFHQFLAEHGYTVLDVDYRGSAGYGRDVRTAIHGHMGGKDLDDLVDGARYLVRTQRVDPRRIGIYGGSYGGFLTLMALFTAPDTFAAGAALRPVTDWTKYNHGYTANILGLPQENPDAYRRSSPIFFAAGLRGALLICHGMRDGNVFFQDTVRLQQRLIELGKEHWEVAAYPVEEHAFEQPSSWTDEYRRIFRLFETYLKAPQK